ncbi:hypothetical protein EYR36_006839 [Pleurotus pulmonarius]|nr:hypothetical protein EYR36_006839 [Pleurotus pulmonarius]
METITEFYHQLPWNDDLRPYVFSAMTKGALVSDEAPFISALNDELRAYQDTLPMRSILQGIRDLINRKRTQTSISNQQVLEQIELFGQYAILSHRWDGEELSFIDVANLSNSSVQAKKGFKKLVGFSRVVTSHYGCRYIWMDSACISETDRYASIPLMFGWYRRAYVCVVHLATSWVVSKDVWSTRGWTLQEFLAASRLKCFIGTGSDWRPVDPASSKFKFHACREYTNLSPVYDKLRSVTGKPINHI